jgi:hypothetical protein
MGAYTNFHCPKCKRTSGRWHDLNDPAPRCIFCNNKLRRGTGARSGKSKARVANSKQLKPRSPRAQHVVVRRQGNVQATKPATHEMSSVFEHAKVTDQDSNQYLKTRIDALKRELQKLERQMKEGGSPGKSLGKRIGNLSIDEFVAGVALSHANQSDDEAEHLMIKYLGYSQKRAASALRQTPGAIHLEGPDFLHALFGYQIDEHQWRVVREIATTIGKGCAKSETGITVGDLIMSPSSTLQKYVDHIPTDDTPSMLVAAGMLANFTDSAQHASRLLKPHPPYDDSVIANDVEAPFLALSFAIDRALRGYLASESGSHDPSATWLYAAPWVFPFIEGAGRSPAQAVTDYLNLNARRCVLPGNQVLRMTATDTWIETIRNTAAAIQPLLGKLRNGIHHFESSEFEIILSARDGIAVAWVGDGVEGTVTSFDTTNFVAIGLPDPNQLTAVGLAICWYIDCVAAKSRPLPLVGEKPPLLEPSRTTVRRFRASASFTRHMENVRRGRVRPPKAHVVAAHIRHIPDQQPNLDHVAEAPLVLQMRMGPKDTWVRAHQRGSNNSHEILSRLNKYSMLAEFTGLL